ncbi:MAG: hypothetical protein HUK26_02830, partial [Duodenibacillus sp.]|nr:hypothetical protein [Oscillospiraceae bacterium]MCF0253254.1 hypothetical protein [Duodenibacillus sp.]
MDINSAREFLKQLQNQGHFKLEGGRIMTEGAAMHALKDFFSSRKAVQRRNDRLRAKLAEMLKPEGL